jgi:ABC-type transporter Mla subunit MlaD
MKLSETVDLDSFMEGVEKSDRCWRWRGEVTGDGFGRVRVGRRRVYAHRLSWELHRGVIPAGMLVKQRCGLGVCVNPEHLDIVSRKEKGPRGGLDEQLAVHLRLDDYGQELVAMREEMQLMQATLARIADSSQQLVEHQRATVVHLKHVQSRVVEALNQQAHSARAMTVALNQVLVAAHASEAAWARATDRVDQIADAQETAVAEVTAAIQGILGIQTVDQDHLRLLSETVTMGVRGVQRAVETLGTHSDRLSKVLVKYETMAATMPAQQGRVADRLLDIELLIDSLKSYVRQADGAMRLVARDRAANPPEPDASDGISCPRDTSACSEAS